LLQRGIYIGAPGGRHFARRVTELVRCLAPSLGLCCGDVLERGLLLAICDIVELELE
jgi:hypothetical protein